MQCIFLLSACVLNEGALKRVLYITVNQRAVCVHSTYTEISMEHILTNMVQTNWGVKEKEKVTAIHPVSVTDHSVESFEDVGRRMKADLV